MSTAEVDLEGVGDLVDGPDLAAGTAARARLERAGLLTGLGQVGELAVWWAGVRGQATTGPARDVVRLVPPGSGWAPGAGQPSGTGRVSGGRPAGVGWVRQVGGRVRTVPLDPPRDPAAATAWGVHTADRLIDAGTDLLLVSAPDPVAARVLTAELLGMDAVEANGWPQDTEVDDATWMQQVTAIRDGLYAIRGHWTRPSDLLDLLGSRILAAATGLLLRSAARRTPCLLDGSGAVAAGLLAQRITARAPDWWQLGHLQEHPAHRRCLGTLRLEALTRLGITVENGLGSLLGLAVLDLAAGLLADAG